MKYLFKLLAISLLFFYSTEIFAQKETKKWSIGIFLEYGFPQNDAKLSYHSDEGMTFRLSIHAGPGFATLSGGAVGFIPKLSLADTASSYIKTLKAGLQLPVKAGYKFIFKHHFFVMAEGGYSYFNNYYEDDNSTLQHASSGGFTYAGTAGFQFSGLEIGCKYEAFQLPTVTITNIGVRLGLNF